MFCFCLLNFDFKFWAIGLPGGGQSLGFRLWSYTALICDHVKGKLQSVYRAPVKFIFYPLEAVRSENWPLNAQKDVWR
jgi:hypothetical protein